MRKEERAGKCNTLPQFHLTSSLPSSKAKRSQLPMAYTCSAAFFHTPNLLSFLLLPPLLYLTPEVQQSQKNALREFQNCWNCRVKIKLLKLLLKNWLLHSDRHSTVTFFQSHLLTPFPSATSETASSSESEAKPIFICVIYELIVSNNS